MSDTDILTKMYEELQIVRREIKEIKSVIIPEDEPTKDEIEEIKLGLSEVNKSKYRRWKDIKGELTSG